jgi:hypothetical protein
MAKKKVQMIDVVFVETFKGAKFLFRTDKPYQQELTNLFIGLIEQCPLGSVAHVSKRVMDITRYDSIKHAKIVNGFIQTTEIRKEPTDG